jgi:hypothetical protein
MTCIINVTITFRVAPLLIPILDLGVCAHLQPLWSGASGVILVLVTLMQQIS